MKHKNTFSSLTIVISLVITIIVSSCSSTKTEPVNIENARIKALIVNGQMNKSHDDKQSSPILEKMLELTGEFNVEIASSPSQGEDMSTFKPQFSNYDVVILDYDGDDWPDETKTKLNSCSTLFLFQNRLQYLTRNQQSHPNRKKNLLLYAHQRLIPKDQKSLPLFLNN